MIKHYRRNTEFVLLFTWLILSTYLIIGHPSCATTKKHKDDKVKAGEYIQFIPQFTLANIQCLGGRYPQIFNPESKAEWSVSSTNGLVMINMTLDSSFPDMSIAYDSVRLRNFEIHLIVNEQAQFQPVQITIDKSLEEIQEGTIRRFKRNIELSFPILASQILVPKEGLQNVSVNLLIKGFDTAFCFTWKPKVQEVEVPASMKIKDEKKSISNKIRKIHKNVLGWTHTFD